ncbi:PREDICTED: jouberin-like, partial [Acropora digitifera]|uniref:jouberin-like n=1 Tax=Acropora digitifera TaxID=70779 RepID=UPI00077B0792
FFSLQESRKKKKKKRTHTSDAVLETIKSGSPIAKTTTQSEQNLLQANLYKEDDPRLQGKENKQSYKELLEGSSVEQTGLSSEQTDQHKIPKRTKHKKTRTLTSGQDTPDGSQDKPRRRKKPKTPEPSPEGGTARENLGFENEPRVDEDDQPSQGSSVTPKKRGGRARRRLHDPDAEQPAEVANKRSDDGYILSVTIHRADNLKPDLCIAHPMVRVHVVDIDTGQYVKKSDSSRSVTSYYENETDTPVDYIMPMMTQPFDFKKYRSLLPCWEEGLLFNEIFSYLLSRQESDPKVILFFEVVDFLTMNATKRQKSSRLGDEGWYRVAWAFLKVVGGNGTPNTDKKVRLQLFQPPRTSARSGNMVEVYQWWKQAKRVPYPSTLYVTLKGVQPPKSVDPSLRSMFAIQQEKGKLSLEEFTLDAERRAHGMRDGKGSNEPINWNRLPGQVCSGALYDATVSKSWDTTTMMTSSIKLYPHPCFVYAAQYHPGSPHIVVTGGYDHYLRVWTKLNEGLNGKLLREIEGHDGFINSICFDKEGAKMFSADSIGVVMIWNSLIHPQADTKRKRRGTGGYVYDWTILKKIAMDELQGNVINALTLHPNGRKLLVHVRNSVLCMLDLRSYTIMQRYLGASNFKEHIRSTLSACGTFVISGSEDGYAYVWNTETGDLVSVYTSLRYHHAVSDVQFHPLDHIVAFASFGDSHPVLLYHYDPKVAKEEAKRFMSPPVTPSKQITTSQEVTTTPYDVSRHSNVADVASDVLRMRKVKQKLDSVLETPLSPKPMDTAMLRTPGANSLTPGRFAGASYSGSTHPGKRPGNVTFQFPDSTGRSFRQGMGNASLSTWGSDFSPTMHTTNGISPQSPLQSVSQLGGAKAKFSFTDSPVNHLLQQATPPRKQVVAMFPYDANRADELSIQPGDVITVLYIDNENWWMGELADGTQGYFPSNYVTEQEERESEADLKETTKETVVEVAKQQSKSKSQMTAVISNSGNLTIVSGPEDSSDAENKLNTTARHRRRHREKGKKLQQAEESSKEQASPVRTKNR